MDHHIADKEYIRFFEAYEPTRIAFGEAAFTQLGEEMLLSGGRSVAIITGGRDSSMKSGAYRGFINMALGFEVETPIFSGVPAEPSLECVREIVKHLEFNQPSAVAAVGGGSVMDAAKAAYLSWQTGLDVSELFGVDVASKKFPGRRFRSIIGIPTTAGTGSEVTPYANIVDVKHGVKRLIMEKQIVPGIALVDPAFTCSMPRGLTAATALDALTHSIESALNIGAKDYDPAAPDWALESVKLIRYALPVVLGNPNSPLEREMLAAAATLGGMCIKARPTSLPHLCSFSLWGKVPHGLAVALLLPGFWRYYLAGGSEEIAARTMAFAGIFPSDEPQTSPEKVVDACEAFIRTVSPVKKLSEIPDFDAALAAKTAKDALLNPMKLESAPRSVSKESAEEVISSVLSAAL